MVRLICCFVLLVANVSIPVFVTENIRDTDNAKQLFYIAPDINDEWSG